MSPSPDKALEVLHDHYKETFEIIRKREKTRDQLFLLVVGLIGLLFLFALFPVEITGSIATMEISMGGAKIEMSKMPLAILSSITWSVLFILVLRYCQTAVTIERQYNYLHVIEDEISPAFGEDKGLYRREGQAYKKKKPWLTHWAWILYTIVFPGTGIVLMLFLVKAEAQAVEPHTFNLVYDRIAAFGVFISLLLFVAPQIKKRIQKLRSR